MPVETVGCPECHKKLRVPEDLLGKQVKCPTCSHVFTADLDQAPPPLPSPSVEGPLRTSPAARPGEDDEEHLPARRGAEDDETRPRRRSRRDDHDHDDKDEEDDYDRPRRRRRRDYAPHRGGMILAFGIMALVLGFIGIIFGIIAWVMGNNDLREIRARRMDPEGESLTNAGRVCGMIGTLIYGGMLLICCPFWLLGIMSGAMR